MICKFSNFSPSSRELLFSFSAQKYFIYFSNVFSFFRPTFEGVKKTFQFDFRMKIIKKKRANGGSRRGKGTLKFINLWEFFVLLVINNIFLSWVSSGALCTRVMLFETTVKMLCVEFFHRKTPVSKHHQWNVLFHYNTLGIFGNSELTLSSDVNSSSKSFFAVEKFSLVQKAKNKYFNTFFSFFHEGKVLWEFLLFEKTRRYK